MIDEQELKEIESTFKKSLERDLKKQQVTTKSKKQPMEYKLLSVKDSMKLQNDIIRLETIEKRLSKIIDDLEVIYDKGTPKTLPTYEEPKKDKKDELVIHYK